MDVRKMRVLLVLPLIAIFTVCSMTAVAATKQSITAEVPLKGTSPTSVGISGPGYASSGPCTPSPVHRDSLTIPLGGYQTSIWVRVRTSIRSVLGWSTQTLGLGGGANQVTIKLTITLPSCGGGDGGTLKATFPVIFFFNGFACSASYYKAYAERLASWGYAVVQYDTPIRLPPIDIATELTFLEPLLNWLEAQNKAPGGFAEGLLNLDILGVAGHSRGGKLAALHFAGKSPVATRIRGAYLIDPVDNTTSIPTSASYPSATDALRASGKSVGVSGATLIGLCNPEGSNFKLLYAAAGEGSWLEVVESAGHCDFLSVGILIETACGATCFPGSAFNPDSVSLTLAPLTAWLDTHLRVNDSSNNQDHLLEEFYAWMQAEQSEGKVEFSIKKNVLTHGHILNANIA